MTGDPTAPPRRRTPIGGTLDLFWESFLLRGSVLTMSTLTLLASVDPLLREQLVTTSQIARPDLTVVRYELATIGLDGTVHRTVAGPGGRYDLSVPTADGCCLSCLVREDLCTSARELPRAVLVVLPATVEPGPVAAALLDVDEVTLDAVVVAVDGPQLASTITTRAPVADDTADDRRSVAEVLARSLEVADIVVTPPVPQRLRALLRALAPQARRIEADAGPEAWLTSQSNDPLRLLTSLDASLPHHDADLDEHGVVRLRWTRRRPLHPARLLHALESGALDGVIRVTGVGWTATRPTSMLHLELAAGICEVGHAGRWIAADEPGPPQPPPVALVGPLVGASGERADEAARDAAALAGRPLRRAAAAARWHPRFGDRLQELTLVAVDREPAALVAALDACLLTDTELVGGPDRWQHWPDPLALHLGPEDPT